MPYLSLDALQRKPARSRQMKNPVLRPGAGDRRRLSRSSSCLGAFFTIDPTEQALVLRFGQPVRDLIDAPGLFVKWPFIDSVIYIDKRILDLDESPAGSARRRQPASRSRRLHAIPDFRSAEVLSVGRLDPGGERPTRRHAQFRAAPNPGRSVDHRHRAGQARRADGATFAIR